MNASRASAPEEIVLRAQDVEMKAVGQSGERVPRG